MHIMLIYIYIYVYIYIYIYVCVYKYMHACMHTTLLQLVPAFISFLVII